MSATENQTISKMQSQISALQAEQAVLNARQDETDRRMTAVEELKPEMAQINTQMSLVLHRLHDLTGAVRRVPYLICAAVALSAGAEAGLLEAVMRAFLP